MESREKLDAIESVEKALSRLQALKRLNMLLHPTLEALSVSFIILNMLHLACCLHLYEALRLPTHMPSIIHKFHHRGTPSADLRLTNNGHVARRQLHVA